MICDTCGREGAEEVIDPFLWELYDEEVYRWMCDECWEERKADV